MIRNTTQSPPLGTHNKSSQRSRLFVEKCHVWSRNESTPSSDELADAWEKINKSRLWHQGCKRSSQDIHSHDVNGIGSALLYEFSTTFELLNLGKCTRSRINFPRYALGKF